MCSTQVINSDRTVFVDLFGIVHVVVTRQIVIGFTLIWGVVFIDGYLFVQEYHTIVCA